MLTSSRNTLADTPYGPVKLTHEIYHHEDQHGNPSHGVYSQTDIK